jgi:hypothetical protein
MTLASLEMVRLLLESGANAYATEISGNNPLMCACTFNRVDNVKFWLNEFPDWNLEARNTTVGGVALGLAVFMGPNRLELTRLLINRGAKLSTTTYLGASILISTTSNEDADPDVVRLLLEHGGNVHYQLRAKSVKWKLIHRVAKISSKITINKVESFAWLCQTRSTLSFSQLCASSSSGTRSWLDCIALRREKR